MAEPQMQKIERSSEYEVFQRNRRSLSQLAFRLRTAFEKLGIDSRAKGLAALETRLDCDRFKVMVLGEFKTGKSTFINALLREEVLPAYAIPCTAVINEVKWAEEKRAVLHFRHPLPSPLTEIPPEVAVHVHQAGGQEVPSLEVPIDRLREYVVIPDPAKDQADSIAESPYERVEIFWPLELCQNGVEIIDSPGLNENVTRARISKDYVAGVDAILFVFSCAALAGTSELHVIDNDLRSVGHEYLFFICNRFDQIRATERARVVEFGRKKLAGRTELGQEGIFFLSAFQALDAQLRDDPDLFEASGMAGFEKALTRFLTQDRGKVKLLQPARELVYALDEGRNNIIPGQLALLEETLASLEAKFKEIRPQLDDAERSKNQIVANMNRHRSLLRDEVCLEAERFLRGVTESLEGWVGELDLENSVKLLSFHHKEQLEALGKEICTKVSMRFENEITVWKKGTLEPLVQRKVEAMLEDANVRVTDFCSRIDSIRSSFSTVKVREDDDLKAPSNSERFFAAIGGLLLADVFSAAHGARFGFKGLGVSILTQVGTYALLYGVLGVTNPLILVPTLISAGLGIGWFRAGKLTNKARNEIARSILEQFRADLAQTAQSIGNEVHEQTAGFVHTAEEGLDREIQTIREQMESVLHDKQAGEVQVQAKKRLLVTLESEMRDIDGAVTELIFAVAGK